MSALVVLAAVALWALAAFLIARAAGAAFPAGWRRWSALVLAFGVLLPLPVLDELLGRRQFEALCKAHSAMQVDPAAARGRTVYDAPTAFADVGGTWVRVSSLPVRFVDAASGETVVGFREFRAHGGLLAQALGFPEGGAPLTFEASCSPAARGRLGALFKQLQITLIRRPQPATEK